MNNIKNTKKLKLKRKKIMVYITISYKYNRRYRALRQNTLTFNDKKNVEIDIIYKYIIFIEQKIIENTKNKNEK